MCEVCAVFGIGDHWTDAANLAHELFPAADIQRHRNSRRRRIALINRIVGTAGLVCQDWDGEAFVLEDRHGRQAISATLSELWGLAERIAGREFDPLATSMDPLAP